MIEIHLDPILARLGPFVLSWHGLLSAVGLAVGVWLTAKLVQGTLLSADDVVSVALPVTLGGIVGARLLFVLENLHLFDGRPLSVLAINEGGISVYGAVIGGSIAGAWYARAKGLDVAALADRAGIGFLVGQGIGRSGDIINGEHHGRAAAGLPWSVVYTHPNTDGELNVPVHPAVAYEMLWDFAAAALLVWLLPRQPRDGIVYAGFMILYGLGRLWVGFFRKDATVVAGLGMAQLIGLASIAVAVPWLVWLLRSPRRTAAPVLPRARRG